MNSDPQNGCMLILAGGGGGLGKPSPPLWIFLLDSFKFLGFWKLWNFFKIYTAMWFPVDWARFWVNSDPQNGCMLILARGGGGCILPPPPLRRSLLSIFKWNSADTFKTYFLQILIIFSSFWEHLSWFVGILRQCYLFWDNLDSFETILVNF